jgi:hypothetical protein
LDLTAEFEKRPGYQKLNRFLAKAACFAYPPKTPEGLEKSRKPHWIDGYYSVEQKQKPRAQWPRSAVSSGICGKGSLVCHFDRSALALCRPPRGSSLSEAGARERIK